MTMTLTAKLSFISKQVSYLPVKMKICFATYRMCFGNRLIVFEVVNFTFLASVRVSVVDAAVVA